MNHQFQAGGLTCERWVLGPLEVNTYLVYEPQNREVVLVDPADASERLLQRIQELKATKTTIFLTHAHADHIAGVSFFRGQTGAPLACSSGDAPMLGSSALNLSSFMGENIIVSPPEIILQHQQSFSLGPIAGTILAIPGHTPGGMVLVFPSMVFSGDTLFAGSIGRSDFPGGDGHLLVAKIQEHLLSLSDRLVFPGHGPETSINTEITENPFFD